VPVFKKQPTPFQRIVATQFLRKLGPGLITGASDDDPSGIGTYSQAGAQLGYSIGWTMLLTYPLMVAIQEISARIGRTTGHGISGNLCRHYPSWLLHLIVTLLFIANTINIGADLSSMADAARVLLGGRSLLYVFAFTTICVGGIVFIQYKLYVTSGAMRFPVSSCRALPGAISISPLLWPFLAQRFLPTCFFGRPLRKQRMYTSTVAERHC
jgi:Mn2+/Fe2+ NRAMP family transporter